MLIGLQPRTLPVEFSNVLDGMRCPVCGNSSNQFSIQATCNVVMSDEGSEDGTDFDWADESMCECLDCGYVNQAGEFSNEVIEIFVGVISDMDSLPKVVITVPRFTLNRSKAGWLNGGSMMSYRSDRGGFSVEAIYEDGTRDPISIGSPHLLYSASGIAFEYTANDCRYVSEVVGWGRVDGALDGKTVSGDGEIIPEGEISSYQEVTND